MASSCQTELAKVKTTFFNTIKKLCPDFIVDDNNKRAVAGIFDWCIRDVNGELDPRKGLWIYGNIGTGKSTLMKAVIQFVSEYWLCDCGEKISPKWIDAPTFCGKYATDGFTVFNSIPMGIDEVGTEIAPTNYVGNKLNVIAHLVNVLYNSRNDIPCIVTTNKNLNDTLETYGERAIDRIGQLFNIVEIKGATRRPTTIWKRIKAEKEQSSPQ